MKPDWDTLMADYQDSKDSLVGDVDCTAGGKSLCEKHDIKGYPTIKYGDPTDMKDYEGERKLDAFKTFAAENLGPTCGPATIDLCDEVDKKFITKFQKWDIDELDLAIEEKDAKMKNIEAAGKKTVDAIQKQITDLQEKGKNEEAKTKKSIEKEQKTVGYKFMLAVKASRPSMTVDPDADPDLDVDAEKPPDATAGNGETEDL